MFKYPWEEEIEQAVSRREHVVEKNWKSVARTRFEEIGTYGLEYWMYFQALRALSFVFLFGSALVSLKLAFVLEGSVVQQQDVFSWMARASYGNIREDTKFALGVVELGIRDSVILGILDMLQLGSLLIFLCWFRVVHIPQLLRNPELKSDSAASFALQVEGIPPRLLDEDANQRYDFELMRHFEAVLHSLKDGDPTSLVCEAALVRNYFGALILAQERKRVEVRLDRLMEANSLTAHREQHLKARIAQLTQAIGSRRMEEVSRPVRRAYVILGTEADRDRLLRRYRWARLPLIGRCLQPKALRFEGRWPVTLRPAPEPADIIWEHSLYPHGFRLLRQLITFTFIALILLAGCSLCFIAWWGLLDMRGVAAAQCGPASALPKPLAPCLTPKTAASSEEVNTLPSGCDCVCLSQEQWHTQSETCTSLDSTEATFAVMACALVLEGIHLLLAYLVSWCVDQWRMPLASDVERWKLLMLACTRTLVPFLPSIALVAWKVIRFQDRPTGVAEPLIWQLDYGWYLHAAPAAAIWCLCRWCGPLFSVLSIATCKSKRATRMLLWERWASLACNVAVTVCLLPVVPCLAPLAAAGLLLRYWCEKYVFLRGLVIVRSGVPSSTAVGLVRSALSIVRLAAAAGAAIAAWAYGVVAHLDEQLQAPVLQLQGPVLPLLPLFCVIILVPPLSAIAYSLCPSWVSSGTKDRATANFTEAWLVMQHQEVLATYQIQEHPQFRGNSIMRELQVEAATGPERTRVAAGAAGYLSRAADTTPSLAIVGDTAPTRASLPPLSSGKTLSLHKTPLNKNA